MDKNLASVWQEKTFHTNKLEGPEMPLIYGKWLSHCGVNEKQISTSNILYLVISRKVYQMIANYMCFMTESAWSEKCVCLTCLRFVVLLGASGFPCMSPLLVRPQTHSFTEALGLRNLSSGLAPGLSWSVHSAGFRGLVFLPCTRLCSPWTHHRYPHPGNSSHTLLKRNTNRMEIWGKQMSRQTLCIFPFINKTRKKMYS